MSLRSVHGAKAKSSPGKTIEALPFNELPRGVPAFSAPIDSAKAARLRGHIAATRTRLSELRQPGATHIAKGEQATLLGRLGGYGRELAFEMNRLRSAELGELARLASELMPGMETSDPDVRAGLPLALEFIQHEVADLGRDVGGGHVPNGPTSFVVSSALILLASRVMFARGDFLAAASLSEKSAIMLSRAHEYTAKRAEARKSKANSPARWLRPQEPTK